MKKLIPLFVIATLFLSCSQPDQSPSPDSLKEAYESSFLIGAAVNGAMISGVDSASVKVVKKHFNTVTPENVMKAGPLSPEPGVYNFDMADRFVDFAEENEMFIVGHTLVWHNQTPSWFFENDNGSPKSAGALLEQMHTHIKAVAGRYAGRVDAWDVVNEVIDEKGNYRPTLWVEPIGGDRMVKHAFQYAEEYAPGAELYYNDFNAWRPAKRDGIMRMVRMLQDEGIRIDGIGIQGHWGLEYPKTEYIEAAIDSFASLGVKVMITEMEVDVLPITKQGQLIGSFMNNDQFQHEEFEAYLDPYKDGLPENVQQELAERYAELFEIFYRKRDKIDRVTLWGVHDGMSWKNGYPIPDRTNYPLLFDHQRNPKQALKAVLEVPSTM